MGSEAQAPQDPQAVLGQALRWDHKSVFTLMSWLLFGALLAGRHWRGWRADASPPGDSLREVHKQLTDDELEDLDPDADGAPKRRRPTRR